MAVNTACMVSLPGRFNASGYLIAKNPVARCGAIGNAAPFVDLEVRAEVHRDAMVVVRVGCSLNCLASQTPSAVLKSDSGALSVSLSTKLKIPQAAYMNIRVQPKSHIRTASCMDQPAGELGCYVPTAITVLKVNGRSLLFGGSSGVDDTGAVLRSNAPQVVQTCYTLLPRPNPDAAEAAGVVPLLLTGDVTNVNEATGFCVVNSGDATRDPDAPATAGATELGDPALSGLADFTLPGQDGAPDVPLGAMPIGAEIFTVAPATQVGIAPFSDRAWRVWDPAAAAPGHLTVAGARRTASRSCQNT